MINIMYIGTAIHFYGHGQEDAQKHD